MSVLRVWNLRRGDDDDNRSSPYGGGFRSLILSAVFEFNYMKAPVGFFALVIGPALLVGIAPSIVLSYGQLLLHGVGVVRSRILFASGLFVVLAVLAILFGKPLFRAAIIKYRHLHYTLVFPLFVGLREFLVTIGEYFRSPSMSTEQLGRQRRVCTVVAALLFAAAGLAVALSIEFSVGLKIVHIDKVRLWPTVKAALGNAAVIIGISTVFESLLWVWLEIRFSGPALDWMPNPLPSASRNFKVAHLSDLHVVGERYGFRMESGTRGPRGNRCFRNALRRLASIHHATPLDRILVTGDVTDAGTRAEWAEFLDILRSCPTMRSRFSFVPGNHDMNIVDRTNPARLDLPWSTSIALRKLRVVLALDEVQGDRAHLIEPASGDVGPTLKEYLREGDRWRLLRELADRGGVRGRVEVARVWNAIFPLVEPATSDDGYGLILLDSNAPSHLSLTNALGVISTPQLTALKSLLRRNPNRAWIILLHHQVVEYPVASISLRDRIGLALVNAPALLAVITPHASRIVILHGHRHRDWIGTCRSVVLASAPSVTMGSEMEKYVGSFHIDELSLGAGGNIRLNSTCRVKV